MKYLGQIIEENWCFLLFLLAIAIFILQIFSLFLTPTVAAAFIGFISTLLLFWLTKEKEIDEKVRIEKIRSYQDFMEIFSEVVSLDKDDFTREQLEKLVKACNKLTLISPYEVSNKVRLFNESFIMSWPENRVVSKARYLERKTFDNAKRDPLFIKEAKKNELILLYRKCDNAPNKAEYQLIRLTTNNTFSMIASGDILIQNENITQDTIHAELTRHLMQRFDKDNSNDTANLISAIRNDIKIKNKEVPIFVENIQYPFVHLPKRNRKESEI